MRLRFAIAALLIIALLVAGLAYKHRQGLVERFRYYVLGIHAAAPRMLDVGDRLPAVSFTGLDGSRATLAARPGRILFVDVFTTWCPDCINETPALEQLRKATVAKPVDIVGLDQQEDPATINQFVARFGLTYPIFIDQENVTQSFGVHYIPVKYIVDDHGVIRGHIIGPQTLAELKRLVDDALHHRPVGLRS